MATAFISAVFGEVRNVGFDSPEFVVEPLNRPDYLGELLPEFRSAVWCAPHFPVYRWQIRLESSISFHEFYYGDPHETWNLYEHGNIPPSFTIRRGSYGFPFKCMYSDEYTVASGAGPYTLTFFENCRAKSGLRMGVPITGLKAQLQDRILPIAPHWRGLILNTLIYGGAFGLLLVLPISIRRVHRVRNQLCLICGYEIEDLAVCPECGHAAVDHAAA